jgi:hypothetical protein
MTPSDNNQILFNYKIWTGDEGDSIFDQTKATKVAIQPKSVVVDAQSSHLLVFVAVCVDGEKLFVVDPALLDRFLVIAYQFSKKMTSQDVDKRTTFIIHNTAFTFNILDQHLQKKGNQVCILHPLFVSL